jgi:hypothetical protein
MTSLERRLAQRQTQLERRADDPTYADRLREAEALTGVLSTYSC